MIATLPFIQKTFDHFNALCFEGSLPPIPFVLTRARTFLGKLEYKGVRGLFGLVSSNTGFRMKISTSFDMEEEEIEDVVIHEMIHYFIAFRNIKDSSAHGKTFRRIMSQINDKYGRHITISHKYAGTRVKAKSPRECYVCITVFKDGFRGVTVAASTKVLELDRFFSKCPDIGSVSWYITQDPYFERFPRSRTPKVYKADPEELAEHLNTAAVLRREGRRLVPAGN